MEIIITGRHLDIGDSLRSHVETSVKSLVEKYFIHVPKVNVSIAKSNLSKDNFRFLTELSFHVDKNFTIHTKEEDDDPYRSFNLALHKTETRIQRYKDRLRVRKRHGAGLKEVSGFAYVISGLEDKEEGGDNPVIIAETNVNIPTISVSDAVMQLDLTDKPAMMFKNAGSGNFNLVYRRPDGHIGWINPGQ